VKEKYGNNAELGYMDSRPRISIKIWLRGGDATIGKFKDETPDNVIIESMHIQAKSNHYLADKTAQGG